MTNAEILSAIDAEITRLQQARTLLGGYADPISTPLAVKRGPGRPKKVVVAPTPTNKAKRVMSAEGKARIAAAQKKRWAASKKVGK